MISSIIEKTVNKWSFSGIIKHNDRDIYVYGLDLLFFTILNHLAILSTAIIFGKLPETLIILIVVIPLQSFGGGYHAKSHLRCFLIMYIGWWGVMFLLPLVTPMIASITTCISVVIIFTLAPVPHENVKMSSERRTLLRNRVRIVVSIVAILSINLSWATFGGLHYGILSSVGLGISAFSMLCAQCRNIALQRIVGN